MKHRYVDIRTEEGQFRLACLVVSAAARQHRGRPGPRATRSCESEVGAVPGDFSPGRQLTPEEKTLCSDET